VQVHTDTVRVGAFNLRGSQQVAGAIRDRLIAQGVPASRVVACGYGESQPLTQQPQWQGSPNARVVWHRIDVPMATFACPVITP
jgi:outer membrane protein OmpA-like peptidoglycan-associated protein